MKVYVLLRDDAPAVDSVHSTYACARSHLERLADWGIEAVESSPTATRLRVTVACEVRRYRLEEVSVTMPPLRRGG